MRPSKLSEELLRIASAIDRSKKPSRSAVAAAIRKVLAAVSVPSEEAIRDALEKALEKASEPFSSQNEGQAMSGGMQAPQVSKKDRTQVVDLGGGWEVILTIENGDPYEEGDHGDYVTVGWMDHGKKSVETVWTGPAQLIGVWDYLPEAAEEVHNEFVKSVTADEQAN